MGKSFDGMNENVNEDNSKKKKIIAIIIAIVLILAAVIGFLIWNSAITAVTMRIQRLVGTVTLFGEDGNEQSLREKMRLGAGQTVTTAGESLIMVSLDDTKLMTMEESSRAEIKTRGKKLLFNLLEGSLFFNVTEKLAENESFDINTSTMVCGIRGTSAYVGRDATSHEILMVTDGLVHVDATNPVTKEQTSVDVPAGQMITIYLDEEAEGNKTISIRMDSFREEDLPAMALDAIRKSPELLERVAKATGFSTKKITTLADLFSTKGVSMYGAAVEELKNDGIEDAIPFMGDRARQMIVSANSAVDIAKDDLPLEVAIIQGYRNVMDVGSDAGYDTESLATLMDGTRANVEDTFTIVDEAGVKSEDKVNVSVSILETIRVSAERMAKASLSVPEIGDVLIAERQLITENVNDAAGSSSDGSKGKEIVAALDRIGEYITGIVNEEMDRSSNGEATVIALLERGLETGSTEPAPNKDDEGNLPEKPEEKADETAKESDTKTTGNDASEVTGKNTQGGNKKTGTTPGAEGTTSAEIKAAKAAIVYTNASNGAVALADGTVFDPTYYATNNPDAVAAYGTSTEALLAHWLNVGRAQGRLPVAPPPVEEKPDWLIRQEQMEREKIKAAYENEHEDHDHGDDNKPSGGGHNPASSGP